MSEQTPDGSGMGRNNEPRDQRPRPPPNRRRDKPTVSCELCRRRKQRCDRQKPCGTCKSKGMEFQCTYASNLPPSTRPRYRQSPSPVSSGVGIEDRLRQLEDRVVQMMKHDAEVTDAVRKDKPVPYAVAPDSSTDVVDIISVSKSHPDESPPSPKLGSLRLSNSGVTYVESTHWSTILDGISELKEEYLGADRRPGAGMEHVSQSPPSSGVGEPILLYGSFKHTTKAEILANLPPKPTVDRLISVYFNTLDLAKSTLHSGEWVKEYKQFWDKPHSVSVIWLGLLYAMMGLAQQWLSAVASPDSQHHETRAVINDYREKVAQCLVLGNYAQGEDVGDVVIETLLHYLFLEFMIQKEMNNGIWLILGITVNLTIKMGYHRDPSHFPNLSPYSAEMRRRLWASLRNADLGISAEMGMKRLIKDDSDTMEPRNLLDSDFDKDTVQLPPSRSETEATPILYILAKTRLISVLGRILDFVTDARPVSYNEVMRIDGELEAAIGNTPSCFRWTSMADNVTATPSLVCYRLYLEQIYQKAKVVLHRRYLAPDRNKDTYAYSRKVAIGAVKKLLRYHHLVDEEIQPSGQFYTVRYKFHSLTNADFLLASFTGCYYLHHKQSVINDPEVDEMEALLRKSQGIWIKESRRSSRAAEAANALRVILGKRDHQRAKFQNPTASLGVAGPSISPECSSNLTIDEGPDFPCGDVMSWDFQMPFSFFNSMADGTPIMTAHNYG